MDDPNIKWNAGKPDFSLVDKKYMAERSRQHKEDSLEKLVENLVKSWEMESSHKLDLKVGKLLLPRSEGRKTLITSI